LEKYKVVKKHWVIYLFIALALSACKTYRLPPNELVSQMRAAQPKELHVTHSATPFASSQYTGNGITELTCYDKKGNKTTLPITPAVEMRITDTNGKKHLFYFDTVTLEDSVLAGKNSRILSTKRRMNIGAMKKVEVQNGGKAYRYK
jgi:hypothetical protein